MEGGTIHQGAAQPGVARDLLRIQLLGAFRVTIGASVIPDTAWRLRKAGSLIKLLALSPNHALHREQLCDLLWPDLDFTAAYNNLRYALHIARRTLAAHGGDAPPIVVRRQIFALDPRAPLWIDAEAFADAAADARRGHDRAAYQHAIDRYTGDLLPEDRYEDWATARREALRETYRALLIECAALYEADGEYPPAIDTLQRALALEPTDEEAHGDLIRLYARSGQRARALGQYAQLRATLQRELDIAPTPAIERLYADVLAGRFVPDAPLTDATPAVPHRPRDLPAALTRFIGRERERAEVAHVLATTPLLTLTGAGGCGKTRLALAVARDRAGDYPDGVRLVELAALADPALVPRAVAAALGLREEPGRPLAETLVEALGTKRSLLVLDNCEHVVGACASLAETLLRTCPDMVMLATSREALRVPGEVTWRVPSLTLPDPRGAAVAQLAESEAVQLFVDRARWRDHTFALTDANAAAVATICWRLDGVPLALELAAARTAVLTPAQLAARLDDALGLLSDGGRTAAPRQQTLRATLDWSHALLSGGERTMLRRLAIFAGGCDLEAAEAICANGEIARADVLVLLAQLADKSLVVVEAKGEEARYSLLEIIRQYAWERLEESGEVDPLQRRHADYYQGVAAGSGAMLRGPEQVAWLDRLGMEHDNLRATLRRLLSDGRITQGLHACTGIYRFWHVRGDWDEGGAWFAAFLAAGRAGGIADAQPALWVDALFCAARLAIDRNEYATATALLDELRALAHALGDDVHRADALTLLGGIARITGSHAAARALLTEGLEIRRALGDERDIAISLNGLGQVALLEGDGTRAETLLAESAALHRRVADPHELAITLCLLGYLATDRGDAARSRALLAESLTLARALNANRTICDALDGCAILAVGEGQPTRALRFAAATATARAEMGLGFPRLIRDRLARALAAARQSLGETEATAAWEAGRALSLAQAITDALQDR